MEICDCNFIKIKAQQISDEYKGLQKLQGAVNVNDDTRNESVLLVDLYMITKNGHYPLLSIQSHLLLLDL